MDCVFSQALTKIVQCLTADTSFQSMDPTKQEKEKTQNNHKRVQYHSKIRKRIKAPRQKIKHPPFTQWEDRRILELVLELGPRFQEIHKHIPDRTLSLVKNRYYKYLRYNWSAVLGAQYQQFNFQQEQTSNQVVDMQFELEKAGLQMECQEILSSLIFKMTSFFSEI